MLNEERVILMTKMASYEKQEGKKNMKIGSYFRSDYVALEVAKSVVCVTIAFAFLFALYIFYDLETFMQQFYEMDMFAFVKRILTYYAIVVVGYGAIAYGICTYRYVKAKRSLKRYYQNLKKLGSLYEEG